MGKIKQKIKHKEVIALDTMVFIYHFERNKLYKDITTEIFNLIERGNKKGITSILSLLEILIKPKKENNDNLIGEYKFVFKTFPNLTVDNVNENIVDYASTLRAKYNITTPDAIQIATAIINKAQVYITNDEKLKKITEIEVILLDEFLK